MAKARLNETHSTPIAIVLEMNRVLLLALTAIDKHRRDTAKLYGIDAAVRTPSEPWTSTPEQLDGLQYAFDSTQHLLRQREQAGDVQDELKGQLCSLASSLLMAMQERLLFLSACVSICFGTADRLSLPARAAELQTLKERFEAVRARCVRAIGTLSMPCRD